MVRTGLPLGVSSVTRLLAPHEISQSPPGSRLALPQHPEELTLGSVTSLSRVCHGRGADLVVGGPGGPANKRAVVKDRKRAVWNDAREVLAAEVGVWIPDEPQALGHRGSAELPVDGTGRHVDAVDGIEVSG